MKSSLKFLSKEYLKKLVKGGPKAIEVAHQLDLLHHKYGGKQACKEARKIRRSLRKKGIYLSKMGHYGPRHD